MDGSTTNAASAAHSTPGSHPGPVMNAAQGSDKMPSQTQNPGMPVAAGMLGVYFHQRDDPYFAGLRTQTQNQVSLGNVSGLSSAFQYRTSYVPPSESSIVSPSTATDSGYVSAPRHSIGIPSTYGGDADHFTDTQSMTGRLDDIVLFSSNFSSFPVNHAPQPNANVNNWVRDGQRPMPGHANNQAPATNHACSMCNQGFRTASDLKKHEARHTRPHHCQVPNCQRTKGFSTANDLARHTRSRHPDIATGHFYKCNKGSCANSSKLWPRADNFRQHLIRKHHYPHSIENIDEFLYSGPEPTADPNENGPAGLHMSNDCSDPATIQPLTSRTLGDPVGLDDRQVDTRMAHSNSAFSQHVSTMVGIQFSDMPPPGSGTSQIELHQPDDGQATYSGHDELHLDPATPQRLFSVPGSDVLEPRPGGESIQISAPERYMATENRTSAIYQDRQPHSYPPLTSSADTDLSRSGSLSAVSDAGPEHASFADMDEDCESECQPTDPGDDQDLPGENDTSVATPETGESEPIPAISPEEAHQAPGPSPVAIGAPNPPRPAPGEDHNAVQPDPQELVVKYLEQFKKNRGSEFDRLLEKLGYEKSRPSSSKSKNSSSSQGASSGPGVACKFPGCEATFQRECELRKHMKRHDKPYGCTFKPCTKTFGSKSDWKRHENSQHSPVDMWNCDEYVKRPPGGSSNAQRCNKVCYRRETFKFHLQKEHRFDSTHRINEKLESCRRAENCGSVFWCGFCVCLIEAKEKDGRWAERYDHIDAHICGRDTAQRRFSEWKHQDDDVSPHLDALPSSGRSESGSTSAGQSTSGGSGRCSTGSPPTDSSRDKRINDEELSRRAKRAKVGGSSRPCVWFCCNCRYFNSLALVDTCGGDSDCGHVRCAGCMVRETAMEPDLPGVT
ncbi:hypothetical protein MAPG_05754 [Magnaporthiopsis poae ATCC 64411]|uniref:C2H2-type domain-containing protein n=1 Tax=Magnaporthiopsis poae (strain ATCC 64411 / 73-15) TaxID=644358 RepID=A0A0C4E088_MAGP6|nr:hypothetical protein MAPG_05754 [Magnaporthiopsis poae ATCC 64411]